jgi:cytochrome c556
MRAILALSTSVALLAACNEAGESNNVVAEATASGNEASNVVENMVEQSNAAPLEKQQALALMKQRHDNYEKIGDAMKAVTEQLRGDSPDLAQVRQHAGAIAQLAPQVRSWFPAGTGPDVGRTHAKAEIWTNPEDFAAKARAFNDAAQKFNAAAQGSDIAAIKSAHADLGKSCKACHDLYREKE